MEMTLKATTSNVEPSREKFEEPVNTFGQIVRTEQIWVDSNLIPKNAPDITNVTFDEDNSAHVKSTNDGATIRNLIDYYKELPLEKVPGTINCYRNNKLVDIITEDSTNGGYVPKILIDGKELAYGVGAPIFDQSAGTLYFKDKDFAEKIKGKNVSVSFYRYVGRKGTSIGSTFGNPDLPFRDSLEHFKNEGNDSNTATFKVRGSNKHTDYVLPPENGKHYDKRGAQNTGVVLLQENLEDVLWVQNTKISGGEWIDLNGTGATVYRYHSRDLESGEYVEGNKQ
jgi:hypothetical protein